MTINIEPYRPAYEQLWDDFVTKSANGTFLFYRRYMEYHSDRFKDASLLVFDEHNRLLAVLPANRNGDQIVSHEGLSYGGFVTAPELKVAMTFKIFTTALEYMRCQGLRRLTYKAVPLIYYRQFVGETSYALAWFAARLVRRDVLSVIMPAHGLNFQERRRRSIKKANCAGLSIELTERYPEFWPILERNLADVYGVRPVHSLDEIQLLHERFPNNIRLFCALDHARIIAGVVIYETEMVAHVQYVGNTLIGRGIGAVDLIYYYLLSEYYKWKPYFDFGNSVGKDAWGLNLGVLEFKESFGAKPVVQDFFEVDLREPQGMLK